jgi:ATP-dependent Clp protease ATP-binding subunit ClpC
MPESFDDRTRSVIALAHDEARRLNHAYVGTEHLLLAIFAESSNRPTAFNLLGVDLPRVRSEVEQLIQRGPDNPDAARELPLTPRAKRAIEFAQDEAATWNQRSVAPEHLLLGLIREHDGVAAVVLRRLGLSLDAVRQEILKPRLMQIKLVERAVRPVRARTAQKRKMREELLAHLTTIYDDERERLSDPAEAFDAAARRFGDPAELARDLERALPAAERLRYHVERRFAWRAPESAVRFTLRLALQVFVLFTVPWCLAAALFAARLGWDRTVWTALAPVTALLVILPLDQFLLGLLYIKMRDAFHGAFGARKSPPKALAFAALMAAVVLASGLAFVTLSTGDPARALPPVNFLTALAVAVAASIAYTLQARFHGPTEITDTLWACLDLTDPCPPEPA